MIVNNLKAKYVEIMGNAEIRGDLHVHGNLKVDGDIIVKGSTTAKETIVIPVTKESDKKLICKKCKGTRFVPTGGGVVYSVYIENGTPPSTSNYRCANCGNIEIVENPAVYNKVEPKEIPLP